MIRLIRKLIRVAAESERDSQVFAAITVLFVLGAAGLALLVTLVAWKWWLGLPVVLYLLYRLASYALGQDVKEAWRDHQGRDPLEK